MPQKTARLAVLDLIDKVMQFTVPQHEAMCDEGKCDLDNPCPFCKINDIMTGSLATEAIDEARDIDIEDGA
jgi:hypothetical protein